MQIAKVVNGFTYYQLDKNSKLARIIDFPRTLSLESDIIYDEARIINAFDEIEAETLTNIIDSYEEYNIPILPATEAGIVYLNLNGNIFQYDVRTNQFYIDNTSDSDYLTHVFEGFSGYWMKRIRDTYTDLESLISDSIDSIMLLFLIELLKYESIITDEIYDDVLNDIAVTYNL